MWHDDDAENKEDKEELQHIEDITSRADEIQGEILAKILSRNANVEYLRQYGCTDASTFKKLIPLISYEQLKPYIDRIANGDDSPILCADPITEFFISSGTSGAEEKLIPMVEQEFKRRLCFFNSIMPRTKQLFPNSKKGRGVFFCFTRVAYKTKAGILAHSAFSSLIKILQSNNKMTSGTNTSPSDTIFCTDTYQSIYCQLLCGLYQNDIVFQVGALFGSTLTYVVKFLKDHWILLANDIRTGTINPKITDLSVRDSVMTILKLPNPQLADFIETECRKENWEGIIKRLWPNTEYIKTIVSGSMSQYIPMVNYYSNNLPIISDHYGSSECFLGLNLDLLCKPEEISYTLIPTMAYFEFLPIESENSAHDDGDQVSKHDDQLVDLVDVKLGQEYELVITTFAGLYRYSMGDILRVTGFKNKAPSFSFVRRKNTILSVDTEKTDEAEVHNAVQEAANILKPFGAAVVDYTSYADTTTIPGHYVLYWEIRVNEDQEISIIIPSSIFEDCCLVVEESLNVRYRKGRSDQDKCINPLEIRIVKGGTFEKLMEQAVKNRGASISQYKTPRCIKSTQIINLLDSFVLSRYFSQKSPKWNPTARHHLFAT